MSGKNLQRRRYIGLLRCSTHAQSDTSITDQRRVLEAYAKKQELVFVDEVVLGGVSGSLPGARDDIENLIKRKEQANDFEVLLVQDSSRLTRAGIKHAHHLEWILNAAGIVIVYTTGRNADGWVGDLETSFNAGVDQAHAKSISFGSARGSMSSILDGRSPYCRRPPYGIDRLYVMPNGEHVHVVRNLPDRRQLLLDPKTGKVLRELAANDAKGVPNHYIKQKQERIVLVPGDKQCVATAQRIYRRHYVDGLGTFRIAKELNEEGIPSPNGKKWNTHTIGQILRNPIYLGRGIANRYTAAVYNMRGDDGPVPRELDPSELCNRARPARITRPASEWRYQEHAELADLIERDVRAIAAERQEACLQSQADGHKPKPNRDRHRNSSFFLKGILHSKQGNEPMTGATTGKVGSKRRYYRVNRAFAIPDGDSIMRRMIPADQLEATILDAVRWALLALPDLRDRVEQRVRAELDVVAKDNAGLEELQEGRATIRKKLAMIIEQFNPEMQELVADEIGALKAQLHSVDQRIKAAESAIPTDDATIDRVVDETVTAIENLAGTLGDAPPATLRNLLSVFVTRLEVDLETRALELEIGLPNSLSASDTEMCFVGDLACKTSNETHRNASLTIAVCSFEWVHKGVLSNPDDCCRRSPLAA